MKKILVVDDEMSILTALEIGLEDKFEVFSSLEVPNAFEILEREDINVVLLDQRIGDVNGIEVLQKIKASYPYIIVIAMTAYASIENSVDVIQRGAYYYISKPLNIQSLIILIEKSLEYQALSGEVKRLTKALTIIQRSEIITSSKTMNAVIETIDSIKDLDITVLITGESGTGKELVAKSLHYRSNRSLEKIETINCAAIPYNLLESELFGHEKGSFTGATSRHKGKFELADKGTLFFDEIGELDLVMQAKLLRAIQEKKITPIGAENSIDVDVRFIAATNKDLREEIKKGNFREDLYFRLNVVNIVVPPLRKRREDIPMLCKHFINKYSEKFNKEILGISKSAITMLENYDYSGNVRELENIIERAVALTNTKKIESYFLPESFNDINMMNESTQNIIINIGETLESIESRVIESTLEYCGGNKRKTAKVLGISERSLHNKVK